MSLAMSSIAANTALDLAKDLPNVLASMRSNSLVEYTRATRVEPITLVDRRASQLPYIEDVLSTALNMFSGYYLQAVSLSVNVGSIDVLRTLDALNPNRDPLSSVASTVASRASREDDSNATLSSMKLPKPGQALGYPELTVESTASVNTRDLAESANLSIGRLLQVTIESGQSKATFPIQVRLISNVVDSDLLVHTLSLTKGTNSFTERWHKWRSGQITFVKDLLLAQDLIDAHKKNLISDSSGYYKSRTYQNRKNQAAAVATGKMSVAGASSVFVMTEETAKELELKSRKRLNNARDRESLFNETFAMLMFVIDTDWETVTIYTRSIADATQVTIKELQRTNRGSKGPDILEILNALRSSRSPSF